MVGKIAIPQIHNRMSGNQSLVWQFFSVGLERATSVHANLGEQAMTTEQKRLPLAGLLLLAVVALIGIMPAEVAAQSSAPILNKSLPKTISSGAPTFTVRLHGKRFETGAQILFDGTPLPSSRVEKNNVALAEVDQSLVATAGTHTLQLVNPDGGATETDTLTVVDQSPDLFIRLGGNAAAEGLQSKLKITITGNGFKTNSTALVWGEASGTTFVNSTELDISIPAAFVKYPAQIPIMVQNPDGALSNAEIFFIVPNPAKISTIDPDTLTVGTLPVTLTVTATANLKPDATIVINGMPLATTALSAVKLRATIPPSLLGAPGQLIVRIEQEGIQSKDVTLDVAPSTGPFIYTMSPSRIRQGLKNPRIQVIGTNFDNGSTATVDGQKIDIKQRFKQSLVVLLGDVLNQVGTHTVQVTDSNGVASNVMTFRVVPDVSVSTASGGGSKHFGFSSGCQSSANAQFRGPRRVVIGPDGLLYITDQLNNAIRSIDPVSGEVCTVAGNGFFGYNDSGNSLGFPVQFAFPNGLAIAADGTIYVSDNGNSVIRRLTPNGGGSYTVDTYAGTTLTPDRQRANSLMSTLIGVDGQLDGPARQALLRQPDDIIIGPDGTMYFSDAANETVREIIQTPAGPVVQTIAGNGVPGFVDGVGANARFDTPTGLALSPDGKTLFVADFGNNRIRQIDLATRNVSTFAGNGDQDSLDGTPGDASFNSPLGLTIDSDGTLYVVDFGSSVIRVVDSTGNVNTLTGGKTAKYRDGAGVQARFHDPKGIVLDKANRILYVGDFTNYAIRKIVLP